VRRLAILPFILALMFTSCNSTPTPTPAPPQLLSEVTLAPDTEGAIVPTATPTDTPTSTFTATATATATATVTDFIPTLIPTNTLTPLPTRTPTPTSTPTPIPTNTPSLTPTKPPTRTRVPTATIPVTPTLPPCTPAWVFKSRPASCPMDAYVRGAAGFQQFERGFMIWFGPQKVIFAVYQSDKKPRWQQFSDTWTEDKPAIDPALAPPDGMFQPMRGFGLVWRAARGVRDKLGWATGQEMPYQAALQIDTLGNRFIGGPNGEVYQLDADLSNWQMLR